MEAIYPYAHLIHLILGIMFLGYIFSDVFIISALKKRFNKEIKQEIETTLSNKSIKIFPLVLLFLILTGGMMMSKFANSEVGFFNTTLQQLLMIKIALAFIIALGVIYSLFKRLTKQPKNHFMKEHFHKVVLFLGLLIVICAKIMFWF